MGVLVCYDDFTYDVINDYHLDYMLQSRCIIGYDKSGDWVKTDISPAEEPDFQQEDFQQERGIASPDIDFCKEE